MTYRQKSDMLSDLLNQLANDKEYSKKDRNQEIERLVTIYQDDFRHSYAQISLNVQTILETNLDNGECLSQNLQMLKSSVEKLAYDKVITMEICEKVRKLCDHVNLEIGRYHLLINKIQSTLIEKKNEIPSNNCIDPQEIRTINSKINDLESKMNSSADVSLKAAEALDKVDEKLDRNSMSSITTLTIFSAVILAFTGSVTFASGVFSGMSKVSPYRIVFVTSIVGLVVFNLIFMLLYIVGKIVGKSVCCKCQFYEEGHSAKNVCGDGSCIKKRHVPSGMCIMMHKYPYVLMINIILSLVMYYDMLLFFVNHSYYISFLDVNRNVICLLLAFPIIGVVILGIGALIKRNIFYRRTVVAIALSMTEEYIGDKEESANPFGILTKLVEGIKNLFFASFNSKSDVEKIVEKIPEGTIRKKKRYLKKELKRNGKVKIIRGKKYYLSISLSEHFYNKKVLKENIEKIVERIDAKRTIKIETEIDEDSIIEARIVSEQ